MFAKVVHRQLRARDVALAMADGEVMAGTIEKFEAMSSKAAREAKDLRNQIALEQATVEVKREMTVGNLVDSVEAATMPAAVVTSETKNQVVQIQEAKQELRKKARQPDQHESQSSEPSRKRPKSEDGGDTARAARITAALQDLSTPELQILAENCIRELASRAVK